MFKRMTVILSALALTALAGCNTFRGIGQDVERGGEKIQDSAERNRN
jgi:entericidin B